MAAAVVVAGPAAASELHVPLAAVLTFGAATVTAAIAFALAPPVTLSGSSPRWATVPLVLAVLATLAFELHSTALLWLVSCLLLVCAAGIVRMARRSCSALA